MKPSVAITSKTHDNPIDHHVHRTGLVAGKEGQINVHDHTQEKTMFVIGFGQSICIVVSVMASELAIVGAKIFTTGG